MQPASLPPIQKSEETSNSQRCISHSHSSIPSPTIQAQKPASLSPGAQLKQMAKQQGSSASQSPPLAPAKINRKQMSEGRVGGVAWLQTAL
jgi:hypothetical protein